MKENKGVRFLTGFLAFILSILLIISCVSTVMVAGVTSMLKPENIVKLIQSIDYSAFFSGTPVTITPAATDAEEKETELVAVIEGENGTIIINGSEIPVEYETVFLEDGETMAPELMEMLGLGESASISTYVSDLFANVQLPEGIDQDMLNAFMQSNAAKEIIEQYTDGLESVLSGEAVTKEFTAEDLKKIVDENMDEIIAIAKTYGGEEFSEEELRQKINEMVDTMGSEVVSNLPSFTEIQQELEGGILTALKIVSSPVLTYICVAISALIAMLIYACRFKRAKGLIWLGVDFIIAGAIVALVRSGFDMAQPVIAEMVMEMLGGASATVVSSVLSVVVGPIATGRTVLFVLAAVCIITYIIIAIIRKNKEKKQAEAEDKVEAEAAVESAVATAEVEDAASEESATANS